MFFHYDIYARVFFLLTEPLQVTNASAKYVMERD